MANGADVQEFHGPRGVSGETGVQERVVVGRVLVVWLLWGDSEGGNCQVVQQYVQEPGKPREELPQLTLSNITWFGHGDLYSRKSHSFFG